MSGGFGLGNFAGQLSADELARAYAAAGGRPDELQLGAPPSRAAAPPPPPAPVQQPAPAQEMGLRAARGAPGRAIADIDAAQLEDANARIALAGSAGERQAQFHEQGAAERGKQAERARENTAGAREDVARRREHEDKYQAEADRIYEEMKAHTQPPPPSVLSKVMNIVAMVAASQGKGGAAQGAAMLAGSFGKDPGRWEAEQRANSNLYQNALGMVSSDRSGAAHDLEVAQRMGALESHEAEAALGQIAETSKSAEMRDAALDTQLQLRMHTRSGLRAMEEAKLKAAGAKQRSAVEEYFWKVPFDQLRAMPSQVLGEAGSKVLKERTGIEGGLKKLDDEKSGAPQSADERKMQRLLTGVTPAVTNLRAKLEAGTNVPHPWAEHVPEAFRDTSALNMEADIQAVADILLRDESGAAIGKDEQEKKKRGWGITSGDPAVRRRGLQKMLAEYDSRLSSAGAPAGGQAPGAPGGPGGSQTFQAGVRGMAPGAALPASAAQPVTMIRQDGKAFQVHPSQVARLRAAGWRDEAVAGGSFIAQPADLLAQGGGQ